MLNLRELISLCHWDAGRFLELQLLLSLLLCGVLRWEIKLEQGNVSRVAGAPPAAIGQHEGDGNQQLGR